MKPKGRKVEVKGRGDHSARRPPLARPKPGPGDSRTLELTRQRAEEKGFRSALPRSRRYVITCAQNATPVHLPFLEALRAFCKHREAELVVIPYRFRNPTSQWTQNQESDDWWAAELTPYLFAGRQQLNSSIAVFGDLKIQPTRVSPLAGLDALSHASSAIFASPKVELRSVPTPGHTLPKILTTTGAVTLSNYIEAVTSKIGEFHYTLGACLVEIDGDRFYLRQINADKDTGEFTDLTTVYSAGGPRPAERPLALILGDQHVGFVDPGVELATFGKGGLVDVLRPRHLVYHDLFDGYAVNPHHKSAFTRAAKYDAGMHVVAAEVKLACKYVTERKPPDTEVEVVSSNHDDFLRQWIEAADWKTDPANSEFYLETALALRRHTRMAPGGTECPSPFVYWAQRLMPGVKMLGSESFSLAGVELGLHGDRGPNGARGSVKNLRRIGTKIVIGHSHSPGISEGAYQTGTSSLLRLEYNSGPSSWAHAHVVLYASGKRSLIFIVKGNWRAE